MTGVGRQLFIPLSLAVGFAMVSSYLLSSTLVPVLSTWLIRPRHERQQGLFDKLQSTYRARLGFVLRFRWLLTGAYLVVTAAFIYLLFPRIGAEIFPKVEARQLQLRLRAPTGTRIERTEVMALKAMDVIKDAVGPDNMQITTGFIGVQPPSYPINTIFLFTSGQHESVLGVALKPAAPAVNDALKETLRQKLKSALPNVSISFEAADIISQVMSFGSPTPIEVAVQGPSLPDNRSFAEKLRGELEKVSSLRDLQYAQPLDYPTMRVTIDRDRAGQFGLAMADVGKSLVAGTSSSRFTDPNFWRDPRSGNAFQIQVEIPQHKVASIEDVENLPIMNHGRQAPMSPALCWAMSPKWTTVPRREKWTATTCSASLASQPTFMERRLDRRWQM